MPLLASLGLFSAKGYGFSGGVAATVPGAPTIGTATATAYNSATVSYTAPASDGGSAITSYTATSSPGGLTGTLYTSGSGTITVSGLSGSTSYTFTVKATNAIGQSAASSASNSITTPAAPPTVGQALGGGYFVAQMSYTSYGGTAQYNLIMGPRASTNTSAYGVYKTTATADAGATSVIDGYTNSQSIYNASHPAANFCRGLTVGGYTDWYLPSQYELEMMYYNAKPRTTANVTNYGNNPYSIPIRFGYYSTGTPAVSTAAIFQNGGSECLEYNYYWSSTSVSGSSTTAKYQYLDTGAYGTYAKTGNLWIRAVRKQAA